MSGNPAPKKRTQGRVAPNRVNQSSTGTGTKPSPVASSPAFSATPRIVPALKPSDIAGDGSVDDFCKWIRNFAHNDSGHFVDAEICGEFSVEVAKRIEAMGGYIDERNLLQLLTWIMSYQAGTFTSMGACEDFCRQVSGYVDNDGFIGVKKKA